MKSERVGRRCWTRRCGSKGTGQAGVGERDLNKLEGVVADEVSSDYDDGSAAD